MKIKLSTLRKLCTMHLKFFEDFGYGSVEITRDDYWTIGLQDLYNLDEDPSEFGVGSLVEEWEDMERIMTGEFVPSCVSLRWLAGLFMAVAEQLVDSENEQPE
jgi:hypothetical protein